MTLNMRRAKYLNKANNDPTIQASFSRQAINPYQGEIAQNPHQWEVVGFGQRTATAENKRCVGKNPTQVFENHWLSILSY
jgi:hypothetical protein